MAARFGDANENGRSECYNENDNYDQDCEQDHDHNHNYNYDYAYSHYDDSKRKSVARHYDQKQAMASAAAASSSLHPPVNFKEFTRESLKNIQRRKASRVKRPSENQVDPASRTSLEPDPCLVSGQQLPPALVRQLPPELVGKPIEDIDPFYSDKETFVIISRGKELTRFSAKKALYLLGPFHPIRRIVLYILVSSIFNLFVILTILTNCILMTIQGSEMVENTEIIFTIIYTIELGLKVLARGFIQDEFTYLRDPWNWLDFMVIVMAYLTIVIEDLGNLSVIRTFRVLRALKTVAIIPGMKTIVGAVIDSVKNLKDVVILTLFSLSVFSLLGLQIYMGLLTQKCIINGPDNMTDTEWFQWCNTSAHWAPDPDSEIYGAYRLCGNATGAQSCKPDHTCLQGFGPNPDYGFTNFDTFGWALICSFRLMTQDFWEGLYMQVLKTAGSWHIIFFIVSIFLGSIYLMNLILAIVAMSYNELQRRAEEEEEAAAEDEAAFLESYRLMELQDQMSQFSRSSPDVCTSYRPSVEIGMVGQSVLASLCRNGLLGERVREKLDQQMIMPGFGAPIDRTNTAVGSVNANRSHSLSVNLDYRRHSRASQAWPNGQLNIPGAGVNYQPGLFYDPLMMAASMTELRRKSSVRTTDSYSPTNSQTGSLLGQRRLLPNIGVTGNRLDRESIRSRRRRRLGSPRRCDARSSSASVMVATNQAASRNQHRSHLASMAASTNQIQQISQQAAAAAAATSRAAQSGLQSTRSSTTSDRDLQMLKQKAAMIRIVSDDCSTDIKNETLSKKLAPGIDDSDERCNSDHLLNVEPSTSMRARIDKRSSVQINPAYFRNRRVSTRSVKTMASTSTNNGQQDKSSPTTDSQSTSSYTKYQSDRRGSKFDSYEAAICEQPSRTHPQGRLMVLQHQSSDTQTLPQRRLQRSLSQRRQSSRRNSMIRAAAAAAVASRRCSALSTDAGRLASAYNRRQSILSNTLDNHDKHLTTVDGEQHQQQAMSSSRQQVEARKLAERSRGHSSQAALGGDTQLGDGNNRHIDLLTQPQQQQRSAALNQQQSISMRTLHQRSNQSSPTAEISPASSVGSKGRQQQQQHHHHQLAVGSYLQPASRMHHLSVENFQQFGATRPVAHSHQQRRQSSNSGNLFLNGTQSNNNNNNNTSNFNGNQYDTTIDNNSNNKQRLHSLVLDSNLAQRLQSMSGQWAASCSGANNSLANPLGPQELQQADGSQPEIYGPTTTQSRSNVGASQSLRQRGHLLEAGGRRPGFRSRAPSSVVQSASYLRYRRSLVPTSSNVVPPLLSAQLQFQQQQQQQHQAAGLGGGPVRRMSRDFVRHAGDWSRLSMSANVDLRRLLRLWFHTNPYQSGRGSIGSCSVYSQNNQPGQFNLRAGGYDSPAHSIKASGNQSRLNSVCNSPRPSSVNSWQAYEVMAALSRRDHRYQSDARAFGSALPLDDNLVSASGADKMDINMRDKCIAYCLSCLDILCIWQCCDAWLKIQRIISLLVFDPFTELLIILCILINTLFMALDSDDADEQMRQIFERGNYFFTATFAVEASMKIIALSPKFYFREGWNVFDSIIVGLSLLELGLEGVYGLSVLRSFRLLRVFKLAKSWPTLNLLISIMGKAVGDLGNLTFVLAIIVFIFAVMGMQLFGNKYVATGFPNGELPRWNFTDFMHSFMIVFRILCAEWIEPMWDCLLVGGWPCIPFFLIAVTVGNLVVLNLFLALLLASFGASNLSSPQADNVDTKKLQEAIERFKRFGRFLKRRAGRLVRSIATCLLRRKGLSNRPGGLNGLGGGGGLDSGARSGKNHDIRSHIVTMSRMERLQNIERRTEELKSKIRRSPEHHYHLRQLAKSQLKTSAHPARRGVVNYHHNGTYQQHHHLPIATIPIIVNEASDGNEDLGEDLSHDNQMSDATNSMTNNSANGQQHHLSNYLEPQFDQTTNSRSAEVSSLNSDIFELNLISENGDSIALDERQHAANSMLIERPLIYSNNMQTIREDSHDDSCQSISSRDEEATAVRSSQPQANSYELMTLDPNDEHNPDNRIRSVSMNELAKNRNDGCNEQQQQCDNNENEPEEDACKLALRLKEPLLPKSYSNPDSFQRANDNCKPFDGSLSYEQQQVGITVEGNKQDVEDASQPSDDVDAADRPKSSLYLRAPKRQEMEEEDERALQHIETYIEKCFYFGIICLKWFLLRQYVRKIVEHRYFDQCILILIIISSGTLALEDKHLNDRPTLKRTLDVLDTIFTIIFSLEMIFKWLAFGMRRYFGNIWSWLDFVIVLVSFVNLMASIFGSGKIQALKTMRTLRAMRGLRPLRALQRFQGMRVVVNALIQAIPSIFNVLLVCLIFWLIFSIMGVQMFGGKFWRCLDPENNEVVSYEIASNKFECIDKNLTWANPQINFDNVLNAYLALFQVATFKGWIDIMNSATDSRMRDDQPIREANIYMYFYFVFFVIFGSFFTLNLFIGVIIDNFNEQKKKTGGSLEIFMTDDQKKYYHAMKKMRSKKPIKAMTRPKFKPQAFMFDLTTSKKFDLAIMLIIGLNMFVMALEHYGQSQEFSNTLESLNLLFIAIFTLECLCKIFAMRHFYFREPWNIFDFIVVDLSILGVVMKEYVAKYFVSPTLLRVVRVVKVGRVLRLVKGAKGIRTLLFALAMSLPALFNICLLLFLVMFIYAIFGMSFFMNVRKRSGIDETFNFETFTSSIIVLFQMSTSAGWDLVLDPLMDEENDCQKPDPSLGLEGTCGNKSIAIFYLISYVIVTFLIIINMYIAVILENYSQATEDVQEGLTDDDYEMYYEIWQKFDPDGTQYLPYSKLSDFVDALEDPLRIAKPNELALVVLDINIYQGDQCYCVDILDALTKYFFTRKGLDIQVNEHLQRVQSTLHETPFERITTTYLLKREHYCAKVIQNSWRKWRQRTQLSVKTSPGNKLRLDSTSRPRISETIKMNTNPSNSD